MMQMRKEKTGDVRDLWHSLKAGLAVMAVILAVEHVVDFFWDDDPIEDEAIAASADGSLG